MERAIDRPPMQPVGAELENMLIDEYLCSHGYGPSHVRHNLTEHIEVWRAATAYASQRLTEVECRSHYVQVLHGVRL